MNPTPSMAPPSAISAKNARSEWVMLAVLAAIQFCNMIDFVIIMPLGPQFMRVFDITPTQFGVLVSSYAFAASASGLMIALFIDRFDRKTTLLLECAGFTIGTFLCAIAPSYLMLVCARIVAGAFGGVLAASVFSIVGDCVPEARRGAAMGTVMSSFAIASVLGIPFGLFLATRLSWHAPFLALAGAITVVIAIAWKVLPTMRSHIGVGHLGSEPKRSSLANLLFVISQPHHIRAYGLSLMLTLAGFSVIPYISPYLVGNVGVAEADLMYIYLFGGAFTMFSSRLVGKAADRHGKLEIFILMAFLSLIPVIALTNLPPVPLYVALICTTLFTMSMNARFVPAIALMTSTVEPRYRGSFMSVNASVQHMGTGVAAILSGQMLTKAADGGILHYDRVGWFSVFATITAVLLARSITIARTELPVVQSSEV